MGLFDKMKAVEPHKQAPSARCREFEDPTIYPPTAEPEPESEVAQCGCGAHVDGECAECDGEKFMDRVRAIGDQHAVNPPAVAPPEEDKGTGQVLMGAGETCPGCGKIFKRLGKHKCAAKSVEPPVVREETAAETFSKMKHTASPEANVSIETGTGPVVDQKKDIAETVGPIVFPQKRFSLFLDCLPTKGWHSWRILYFADLVADVADDVAREHGVAHWSIIEFGKGPGCLAAAFESAVFGHDWTPGTALYANTATAETRTCLDVLVRYADALVQAVR